MTAYFLKLGDDETEIVLISNPRRLVKIHNFERSVGIIKVNRTSGYKSRILL